LEKRVKSRFSHRQIFLLPDSDDFENFLKCFKLLLKLPPVKSGDLHHQPLSPKVLRDVRLPFLRRIFVAQSYEFQKKHIGEWNLHVDEIARDEKVVKSLENLFDTHMTIASLKLFLFQIVSNLSAEHDRITASDVVKLAKHLMRDDDKVTLMMGLSVLEICLLIAIKHHCDIYDNDPFNFEMILTRFNKFACRSSTIQNIDREILLKSFENLKHQEIFVAMGVDGKVQKEYQMYKLQLYADQIDNVVKKYQNLPTEIAQWAKSSF